MEFSLTKQEEKKFKYWKDSLPQIQLDVFGKDYIYEFIFYPTSLGIVKKIKRVDGIVLDLTDYDNW